MLHIRLFLPLLMAAVAAVDPPATKLTARQVMDLVFKQAGASPPKDTVDTLKAGDPETPVTGIVTTFAATLDVLQSAAASGKNFIITHEPTFYNHLDQTAQLQNDPVYAAKQEFIRKHGLVVWRFHDVWHRRNPDGILTGMTRALGWERFRDAKQERVFVMPKTPVDRLAAGIRERLKIRTLRVVGEPQMEISRIALIPGAAGSARHIAMLERDDVDAVVIGEVPEWETVEYVRDAVAAGKRKALILLGHVASEEAGMEECARWLKTFLPDMPVEFLPAGEPFWTAH